MEETPSRGFWFTWSSKRGGAGDNKSRLDRALINAKWKDEFSESEACMLAPGISDHCPVLVTILTDMPRRRHFKFFNFWMRHYGLWSNTLNPDLAGQDFWLGPRSLGAQKD